jgi:hypothetical protein
MMLNKSMVSWAATRCGKSGTSRKSSRKTLMLLMDGGQWSYFNFS